MIKNFGGDPDHGFGYASGSGPIRDTAKTCLGGGMHCPNASNFSANAVNSLKRVED